MTNNVAFIGIGNMGHPMCTHLERNGFSVFGYDISPDALSKLKQIGGTPCSTIGEAVRQADYVISMVPTGKHVREVYEGRDGVLKHVRPGAILIDCSTIDIESAKAVNAAAAAAGFEMVDAPVSGAQPAAIAGRLIFMIGGTESAYNKAVPPLKAMGQTFVHIGPAGSGQAMKICNNMMTGLSMVAISEMLTLAERLGLDHQAVYDVVTKSSGNCWTLQNYCPVPGPVPTSPANNDYEPGFSAEMMLKDMRLSQQAAAHASAPTALAAAAVAFYQILVASGHGQRDFSVVYKLISGRLTPEASQAKVGT
jgi:3-hydroxyisobutyrate dehydrogenase